MEDAGNIIEARTAMMRLDSFIEIEFGPLFFALISEAAAQGGA